MIDNLGRWTAEKDYTTYPDGKWCDYDYVANWIRNSGYKIETTIENLTMNIFAHYDVVLDESENGYFEVPYESCTGDYSPNMEDIAAYLEASGGFKEFDYIA